MVSNIIQFKLYRNKSSLKKPNSRYVQGGKTDLDGNKLGWWERYEIEQGAIDDVPIRITPITAKRADLISFFEYGTTDFEWLVLDYNNIVDINEELIIGATLTIPSAARVFTNIATKTITS